MIDILFISFALGILANGVLAAEVCKQSLASSSVWHYYVYCEHGCCGTYYNQECCANYIGLIVGCVIAAVLFFGGIIFLVCLCHHCNKKKTVGVVMTQPAPAGGANINVVSNQMTTSGPYYQQPGYQQPGPYQPVGAYPQPAPMGPNQVPMTAHPSPVTYNTTGVVFADQGQQKH